MKISIITAVHNNSETLEECIKSVAGQNYENIEHIVIDGCSTDGSLEIIKRHSAVISHWTSENDKGIYHALNRGIGSATGDVIGFLHADDIYADRNVIDWVVSGMLNYDVESCYGDLLYVSRKNINKTVRQWTSCPYSEGLFQKGWMPPHPAFFVKKEIYTKYGGFNTDLRIAADYELMLRFLGNHKISTCYIPRVFVKMRAGGMSNRSIRNLIAKSCEDYKACKMNGLKHGAYTVALKNLSKIPQFF